MSTNLQTLITKAITGRRLMSLFYNGGSRTAEPHCLGINTKGKLMVMAFQTEGFSNSREMGWKLFELKNISQLKLLRKAFRPQPDYDKHDKKFVEIWSSVT